MFCLTTFHIFLYKCLKGAWLWHPQEVPTGHFSSGRTGTAPRKVLQYDAVNSEVPLVDLVLVTCGPEKRTTIWDVNVYNKKAPCIFYFQPWSWPPGFRNSGFWPTYCSHNTSFSRLFLNFWFIKGVWRVNGIMGRIYQIPRVLQLLRPLPVWLLITFTRTNPS